MLKNKKVVYILIPLNLLIWGFFAYRIFSAFSETETPLLNTTVQTIKTPVLSDSVIYKLSMAYKDPFLKESKEGESTNNQNYNATNTEQQIKKNIPVKTPVIIAPKQLPDIKYLGLIKNNTSGLSTALVSVNGQSKLIKQNEAMDGIVFKSFNRDSLVAKWGKERIVARK